jgi:uncharacterized radical SAM superfamily Fe-S cluster-containing enzyme
MDCNIHEIIEWQSDGEFTDLQWQDDEVYASLTKLMNSGTFCMNVNNKG